MIAVIDYSAGNVFSVINALSYLNQKHMLVTTPKQLSACSHIILPGVGAFSDAAENLRKTELFSAIKSQSKNKPLLGICLGMQLLFDKGYEFKETEGLGLIEGEVDEMYTPYKVPHMGWNSLVIDNAKSPILKGISGGEYVYFVHSYIAETVDEHIVAHTEYGTNIPSIVSKGRVYGMQFHPEKSGETGLKLLNNFCTL